MELNLPDEILLKIFSFLDKRDLCRCACVSRRWNFLTYANELWTEFSLTDLRAPKWCASKLISIENTDYLISSRFSEHITRVDLSKMCFSFDTLDTLFKHCRHIASLCINFKYLQIRSTLKFSVSQCDVAKWAQNKLVRLYLKNVCDMKTRRYQVKTNSSQSTAANSSQITHTAHTPTSYDLIEMEIIKLIRTLFELNANSLSVLGLKCVDPSVISSCVNAFGRVQCLLLNNINDTDSVLQELAGVCRHQLKCLELNKCREFEGDGLQDVVEQCSLLETLQIGKHIYPTLTELNEINWSNLRYHLKELSITTKFQPNEKPSSSSSSATAVSTTTSSSSTIDLYSSTIFNYLNDSNCLEYLALADFTLRFPVEQDKFTSRRRNNNNNTNDDNEDEDDNDEVAEGESNRKKMRTDAFNSQEQLNPKKHQQVKKASSESQPAGAAVLSSNNLKYLILRNIRNIKSLTSGQLDNIKSFLQVQFNLHTLDLIGLYLDTNFLCSILPNLNQLRVLYIGHGKSYKKNLVSTKHLYKLNAVVDSSSSSSPLYHQQQQQQQKKQQQQQQSIELNYKYIDIDRVNFTLAECCPKLVRVGIFYRQFELKFKRDPRIEFKNNALVELLEKCAHLREISYLKSFKIQEDADDDDEYNNNNNNNSDRGNNDVEDDEDDDDDDDQLESESNDSANATGSADSDSLLETDDRTTPRRRRQQQRGQLRKKQRKSQSYFHYIKYAIEHVNQRVIMKPCYGFDITPTSGHFLDSTNHDFIETSLPPIRPPRNDFHSRLFH